MNDKKALMVVNPVSGKKKRADSHLKMADAFRASGYDVTVHGTHKRGDAMRCVLEQGHTQDILLCYGGDGTYNEVVSAVVRGNIPAPICHLPFGTSNDIARTLDLPREPAKVLSMIENTRPAQCDVGVFRAGRTSGNGRISGHFGANPGWMIPPSPQEAYFAFVTAFGIFAELSFSTPRDMKMRYGYLAYLLEAVRRLRTVPQYDAEVRCDRSTYRGRFIVGCVSNAASIGRIIRMPAGEVMLDDGRMEVLLIRYPDKPSELAGIASCLVAGRLDNPHIVLEHTQGCAIALEEPAPWSIDGEDMGMHRFVDLQMMPRAFATFCGPKAGTQDAGVQS